MVKIAVAAALAAIVITDVTIGPFSTSATATIERPRGVKGDRLPMAVPEPDCAETGLPSTRGQCVGAPDRPAIRPPESRLVKADSIFRSVLS